MDQEVSTDPFQEQMCLKCPSLQEKGMALWKNHPDLEVRRPDFDFYSTIDLF